jgi:hypothetical protein
MADLNDTGDDPFDRLARVVLDLVKSRGGDPAEVVPELMGSELGREIMQELVYGICEQGEWPVGPENRARILVVKKLLNP